MSRFSAAVSTAASIIAYSITFTGPCAAMASAAGDPAAVFAGATGASAGAAAPGRHPAYTFTSLLKPDFKPIVGDMDWMPDGRLAMVTLLMKDHDHLSGPSDVYLLDGVLKGGPEAVTVKKYATGFYTPLGLKVVDGQVYVLDNKEGIIRLTDADRNDSAEARSVIWSQGIKGSDRKWVGGLAFKEGYFYALVGVWIAGGSSGYPQPPQRGTLLRVAKDGSSGQPLLGGLRNPNGIGIGAAGEVFVSDNQGDWVPTSKVMHVMPGEFYGHAETPFSDKPITPPMAWLPHGDLSRSPSAPLILREGPYAGQMLLGEVTLQGIFRVSMEKVGGRLQGCAFPFAWDMPAGVNRLLAAPDGSILVGGVGGNGGWTFKEPWFDLERMTPTGVVPFEMLAVRSLGAGAMEVEFTKPIAAADAVPARFQVRQWRYVPTASYGGPKVEEALLAVQSASLSADGRKARLDLAGLKAGHVVRIRLLDLKSRDGETPWALDAYYTLNAFGPADGTTALRPAPAGPAGSAGARTMRGGAGMALAPRRAGLLPVQVVTADGRVVRDFTERIRP